MSSSTNPNGNTTQTTDTHGNIVTSTDPTAHPDAKPSQKLTGDVKGAVSGTIGSAEAAVGAMLGKHGEGLKEKGLEKMSEEDMRLATKQGVPPVGSERRETVETPGQGQGGAS